MKVFAVFSEKKAGLVRVWARSWKARGWTPRLLSPREVKTHLTPEGAIQVRGGGILVPVTWINFSCRGRDPFSVRKVRFSRKGWRTAGIVDFCDAASEWDVLYCGRPL